MGNVVAAALWAGDFLVTGHVGNYEIVKSIDYPIILMLIHRFNPLPRRFTTHRLICCWR